MYLPSVILVLQRGDGGGDRRRGKERGREEGREGESQMLLLPFFLLRSPEPEHCSYGNELIGCVFSS